MTDALGNEIVIGNYYGYSQNSNGMTKIRAGKVLKINETSVSLSTEYSARALYSDDPTTTPKGNVKVVVKGNMLFPIDKNKINWNEDD